MGPPVRPPHDAEPIHAFAYLSTPTAPFADRDLSDLLLAARYANAAHEVTGKLVVLETDAGVVRFAQWVEGPEAGLAAVVDRILADPRHADVEVRRQGPVPARRFPGWDMALHPAGAAAFPLAARAATG